jgi:hypothetical protein
MMMDGEDELDQEMVAKAEAVIANLKSAYLDWVAEDLRRLTALCDEARSADIWERRALMPRIFTIAHDVKGQGGSFGYDLMTLVGNQLCRFLESRDNWPDHDLAVVIDLVAAMRRILDDALEGNGGEAGATLIASVKARIEAAGGPVSL